MIWQRLFEEGKERINYNAFVAMSVEVPGRCIVVRSDGVKKAMEEFGITSSEIIDAGGLEMTTVEQRLTSYLISHPEATFIIGLGGIVTDRLTDALKAVGRQAGEVIAGGFDMTPGTLVGLKEGYMTAAIDSQQYLAGFYGVLVLYHYKLMVSTNSENRWILIDSSWEN